jgi:hypothetical protein
MKKKSLRLIALASVLFLLPSMPASAATNVAGKETYLFHSYVNNGTNSASDTASLKFMGIEAAFNYDISSVAVGTEVQFALEVTGSRKLTVGTGCCVQGGIDGVWEQQQVSTGGGIWIHTKGEGEKVANLKIYSRYDEFLDGKYKGLLGKLTSKATVKIGDSAPVTVTKSNSSGYKVTYEYATYSKSFTVPKLMTKLWVETMWEPKSPIAKDTVLRYTNPTISIFYSKTKKRSAFKYPGNGFSFSFVAYNDATSFYQEAEGGTLKVGQDNVTVSAGQGINLPSTLPVGSKVTISAFKITKG